MSKSTSNYDRIEGLALQDATFLYERGKTYGDSWKKRGGVGAFMMMARKWDRIENICAENNYDVFECGVENVGDIMDDIADLRRYLLLVEDEVIRQSATAKSAEPTFDYVCQDPDLKRK